MSLKLNHNTNPRYKNQMVTYITTQGHMITRTTSMCYDLHQALTHPSPPLPVWRPLRTGGTMGINTSLLVVEEYSLGQLVVAVLGLLLVEWWMSLSAISMQGQKTQVCLNCLAREEENGYYKLWIGDSLYIVQTISCTSGQWRQQTQVHHYKSSLLHRTGL